MNRSRHGIDYWDYLENEDVQDPVEEAMNFREWARREAAKKETTAPAADAQTRDTG